MDPLGACHVGPWQGPKKSARGPEMYWEAEVEGVFPQCRDGLPKHRKCEPWAISPPVPPRTTVEGQATAPRNGNHIN